MINSLNFMWNKIKQYWKAEITIGAISVVISFFVAIYTYAQYQQDIRNRNVSRMHELVAYVANPISHPEFNSPLGKSLAISELDRLFEIYPDTISPEEMLIAGVNSNSSFPNPRLLRWLRTARLRLIADNNQDPMLTFVANWYVAVQEYRAGNELESTKRFDAARDIAENLPFTERLTQIARLDLSKAGLAYYKGDIAQCKKISEELLRKIKLDGRWYRPNDLRREADQFNNCVPFETVFSLTPISQQQGTVSPSPLPQSLPVK